MLKHMLEFTIIFANNLSFLVFASFHELVLIIDASIGDKDFIVSDYGSIHDDRNVISSSESRHA